eukprot:CAMPEP_0116938024 /NCGR_PEP_ID=MMETSP0467-20121206/31863_1 /TAXON_ID=283647 /ORGANISM="Mesodinium pulex, Strain SPMC105" /LENGTH=97 /DNA_ID=CAMNT_0004619971 /DNA_START=153 /DNA_END=446 /DNA_ORIENTATION=-
MVASVFSEHRVEGGAGRIERRPGHCRDNRLAQQPDGDDQPPECFGRLSGAAGPQTEVQGGVLHCQSRTALIHAHHQDSGASGHHLHQAATQEQRRQD